MDSSLYRVMSRLLIAGVLASVALMILGYALLVAQRRTGEGTWLPLQSVLAHAFAGDPRGILDLGVLVLFATPTLRVVAAIALFAAARESRYIVVSTIVLILLALSVAVSLAP